MKVSADVLNPAFPIEKSWFAVYSELFKARLTLLVLITAMVGFYVASPSPVNHLLMMHAVLGTALVAAGGAALNQLLERDLDAKMRRTSDRPLPSGRLQPGYVLGVGCATSLAGLVYLALAVNLTTCLIGAFTLVTYIFVYTPLKRVTWVNTLVGAIPGAMPPLMGWTAARGHFDVQGLSLFAIQAFWQIPHFMAIAWMYREEYARAGFRMLPVVDPQGRRTSRQALLHTVALFAASLAPVVYGLAGVAYLIGACVLSLIFLWSAIQFTRCLTLARARQLFYVSIIYLPLLLALMVLDRR